MLGRMNDLGTSLWDSIWSPLLEAQALPGFGTEVATLVGSMNDLGTSLWDSIWSPLLETQPLRGFDTKVPHSKCQQLLESARHTCLAFNTWGKCKDTQKELSPLQMDYFLESKESFFEQLPETAEKKFEKTINDTFVTKYQAVKGLIDLHNGENVDVALLHDLHCHHDEHEKKCNLYFEDCIFLSCHFPLNTSFFFSELHEFPSEDKHRHPLTVNHMNAVLRDLHCHHE